MTDNLNQEALSLVSLQEEAAQVNEIEEQQRSSFIHSALSLIQRNAQRIERGGAVALSTLAFGSVAVESAFANQGNPTARTAQTVKNAPTPGSLMHGVNVFYDRTIASWGSVASNGAMNNIQHMDVTRHSYALSAVCNILSKNASNYNDVSLVRNSLRGDYEVTCQNGDQPVEHNFSTIKQECTNTTFKNCRDMNLLPALQAQGNIVATYLKEQFSSKLSNINFGEANRLQVDNYKGKNKSDAELFFAKNSGAKGRQVKEVIINRYKDNQAYKIELYPTGAVTLK